MKNIQLFTPVYRQEEIFNHMSECFEKGWTGTGFKTIEFENEWKKYTSLNHAHFLNSNTSGLHLSLKILKDSNKWNDGDEIITTPLTFVSTNHSILYENLTPIFADVDEFLCIDPDDLVSKITRKTKAVIFVGLGGNTGRLNDIIEICKIYNLKLILDAAHMSGTFSLTKSNQLSHIGYDVDVSVFSFQSVKNLPTADSGMICFQNSDYDDVARKMSWLGIDKNTYQRTNDKGNYKWEYDIIDVGYKYHGNSIMASMGLVSLKYLDMDNERRRNISAIYEKNLDENEIKTIKIHDDCLKPSRHLFQIKVNNRNKFMELLNNNGIFPGVHYRDNTRYKIYNKQFGKCPIAHKVSEELISLPLHLNLTNDDIYYVIENVIKINKLLN